MIKRMLECLEEFIVCNSVTQSMSYLTINVVSQFPGGVQYMLEAWLL